MSYLCDDFAAARGSRVKSGQPHALYLSRNCCGVLRGIDQQNGVDVCECRYTITYPLEAGMVVSNEPGYYEEGEFGIRIENLLVVKEADTPFRFGEQPYLAFERLTMCPLQRKMIDLDVRCCSLPLWSRHSCSTGFDGGVPLSYQA